VLPLRLALHFALFVALSFALLLAPSAAAGLASPYGVNIHGPAGAYLAELLHRTAGAGIGWVRIDFLWSIAEPHRGAYDWRLYDEVVDVARAYGLEVFASVISTPAWATEGPAERGVPRKASDFATFCRRASERYCGRVRVWGLWNEPNLRQFWAGTRRDYIDRILLPGADAIQEPTRSTPATRGPWWPDRSWRT
jgi:hypothetical protein